MITIETAKRVLEVVDAGLCSGLGRPTPGEMCVEAAVCFVLGEPHGDNPSCVSNAVRAFKIRLNDSSWSSNSARAAGMRSLAVAQLGSAGTIDEVAFCKQLAKLTIQRVLPLSLRSVGLVAAADRCESEGTEESAKAAANSAAAVAVARTDAADHAATYAANSANAAAYATSKSDDILSMSAGCCLDALRFVNAPGIELLKQLGLDNGNS